MEKLPVGVGSAEPAGVGAGKPGSKPGTAKPPSGDTSTAAKAILDKYLRRPRE